MRGISQHEFLDRLRPHEAMLEGYCRRVLVNGSDLEDVLQSAIFHAYKKWDMFEPGGNFKAWVFQFVIHECRNANRRRLRKQLQESAIPEAAEHAVAPPPAMEEEHETLLNCPAELFEQCRDEILLAVVRLGEMERSVFLLRALGDFSYREIAGLLGIPMGSVMGYLFRARSRLRKELGADANRPIPGRAGWTGRDDR